MKKISKSETTVGCWLPIFMTIDEQDHQDSIHQKLEKTIWVGSSIRSDNLGIKRVLNQISTIVFKYNWSHLLYRWKGWSQGDWLLVNKVRYMVQKGFICSMLRKNSYGTGKNPFQISLGKASQNISPRNEKRLDLRSHLAKELISDHHSKNFMRRS